MSTVHLIFGTILAASIALFSPSARAEDGPIKPFKDDLFSAMTVLQSADGGDYKVIDYQEMRDINGRDREPERHVRSEYMDTGVRKFQQDEALAIGDRHLAVTRVGNAAGQSFTVVFIHGRGGDRRLGANDQSFGGNFNRLKNLAVRNGGTYYTVSVAAFDGQGADDVGALIHYASIQSGGKPVILACASMGGIICQAIARNKDVVRNLKGMVYLGGPPDADFGKSPFAKARLPLYLAHGSADKVYAADEQVKLYTKLHKAKYPVKLTVFQTGGHGTPIRMVDWREVLNFVLNPHK